MDYESGITTRCGAEIEKTESGSEIEVDSRPSAVLGTTRLI